MSKSMAGSQQVAYRDSAADMATPINTTKIQEDVVRASGRDPGALRLAVQTPCRLACPGAARPACPVAPPPA